MARKGYPPEFRRRVVDLVEGGRKVAEVAGDLGLSEQSIYTWQRQAGIVAGSESGLMSAEKAELAAAKRRITLRRAKTPDEARVPAFLSPWS